MEKTDLKVIQNKDGITELEKQIREAERGASLKDLIQDSDSFLKTDFPEKRYYLGHIIGEQQLILLPGWRGTGKTWFALSMADAISRGEPFGPWAAGDSVPVLYIDGELPPGDLQQRITYLNINQDRQSKLYIYNDCQISGMGIKRASLLDTAWQKDLKDAVLDLGVKVIFFDNISSLTPGIDENAKVAWDPVNQYLLDLRFSGVSAILLHHTSKNGGQRGTSGREDNIDMTIDLKHPPSYTPDLGCEFIVSFSKTRTPNRYLSEIKSIRFKLSEDEKRSAMWSWSFDKSATRDEIIKLLKENVSNKDIAATCNVTPSYVSRIKKEVFGK
jgi:predicted ATP-dependent serine protease